MQPARKKTLSIRTAKDQPETASGDPGIILRLAVERGMCVDAVYNKAAMLMEPHILYAKHGDPFLDAVVILRDGKAPRELKLGSFKVAGLNGVTLTRQSFTRRMDLFDPADVKYADSMICITPETPG